jgi:multidrug resistance protein MdtO
MTSTMTCAMVAKGSFGASLYQSLLRLAGAGLGGFLGLALIVAVMLNTEDLAWLLFPFAACVWLAAWVTAGSSRTSYAGVQIGMALAISVVDVFGPTTDLVPARDRVVGILLGITVMALVSEALWPVRASRAMRPALAAALRTMAGLAEITRTPGGYAVAVARTARHRLSVHQGLAAVLRLREESALEPGASTRAGRRERDTLLRLTGDAQAIFLALLALARHRLAVDAAALPAEADERAALFDRGVREAIEAIASAIEGAKGPLPDLGRRLEKLELAGAVTSPARGGPTAGPALAQAQGEIAVRREVLREVLRLAQAPGLSPESPESHIRPPAWWRGGLG